MKLEYSENANVSILACEFNFSPYLLPFLKIKL